MGSLVGWTSVMGWAIAILLALTYQLSSLPY